MRITKRQLRRIVRESYYAHDYAEEEAQSTPPEDREAYEEGKEDARLGMPETAVYEKALQWKRHPHYARYNDYLRGYDDAVQYHQFGSKVK